MARIAGVSADQAGEEVALTLTYTRQGLAAVTGRETERMIEPLEMYAHVPGLLRGYARLEQATAKLHRCDKRLKNLAELKAATLTHCEYCIDFGSQVARRSGLSDEQLQRMRALVCKRIALEGAMRITKETGLFVARK